MSLDYTLASAKEAFERGHINAFELRISSFMGSPVVWSVYLRSDRNMQSAGTLVDARSKTERTFKTLDAAYSATRAIGFKNSALVNIG